MERERERDKSAGGCQTKRAYHMWRSIRHLVARATHYTPPFRPISLQVCFLHQFPHITNTFAHTAHTGTHEIPFPFPSIHTEFNTEIPPLTRRYTHTETSGATEIRSLFHCSFRAISNYFHVHTLYPFHSELEGLVRMPICLYLNQLA